MESTREYFHVTHFQNVQWALLVTLPDHQLADEARVLLHQHVHEAVDLGMEGKGGNVGSMKQEVERIP